PRECRARGTDPPFPWNRDGCGALGRTGRPLRGATVAAGRRGERHSAARRLRRRRPVAHADLARLRAARRRAEPVRPTGLQLRHLRGEPHHTGHAGATLAHTRAAAAYTNKPERGLLASILAPRVHGSYLGGDGRPPGAPPSRARRGLPHRAGAWWRRDEPSVPRAGDRPQAARGDQGAAP